MLKLCSQVVIIITFIDFLDLLSYVELLLSILIIFGVFFLILFIKNDANFDKIAKNLIKEVENCQNLSKKW